MGFLLVLGATSTSLTFTQRSHKGMFAHEELESQEQGVSSGEQVDDSGDSSAVGPVSNTPRSVQIRVLLETAQDDIQYPSWRIMAKKGACVAGSEWPEQWYYD